jgi:Rad3-related DNA helicase
VLVKNHERVGVDEAGALDWHELAAKRLARLVESEQACVELQGRADRLRKEHCELLANLHGRLQRVAELERELKDREAELAYLRPVMNSWWGHGWRVMQWARQPANWLALVKRPTKRLLKFDGWYPGAASPYGYGAQADTGFARAAIGDDRAGLRVMAAGVALRLNA